LNAGMAHQFALYSDWCFGLVQPRPKAVAEGLPADPGCDLGSFSRSSDVLLLNLLLMKGSARSRVGEQPRILRHVAMLPVRQQLAGSAPGRLAQHRVNIPSSRLSNPAVNDAPLNQQGGLLKIEIAPL
jgi:hypothetical protein